MTDPRPGRANKEELFSELIRQCGAAAYNFALRLAGNEPDARDLVQDAFLRALENIESFDPSRPFRPWLNRILHNLYVDSVRRYERTHVVSLDAPPPAEDASWEDIFADGGPGPGEAAGRSEARDMVQKALAQLDLDYRAAILLSDIEGLSYLEIGKVMSCPVGTVRSRIHRGRGLLKKILQGYMETGKK